MKPIHRTRRLSITLAGLTAAALALPACQGTTTAASHRPHHHHVAQAATQQTENGLTLTELKDLANVKRDLQLVAQQMQRGMTFEDLQDLAKVKRGLVRRQAALSQTVSTAPPLPHATASAQADAFAQSAAATGQKRPFCAPGRGESVSNHKVPIRQGRFGDGSSLVGLCQQDCQHRMIIPARA